MKKHSMYFKSLLLVTFHVFLIVFINPDNMAQGPTSSIGDRENIGIFGGPADDLTYVYTNQRIFAAIHSPATLFYSDDTCKTWNPAFPFDSLEYDLETRGWGGGALRVLSNLKGWVAVQTGYSTGYLSSAVISYDNGNTFQTAFDPYLLNILTSESQPVSAIALSDHYLFTALGKYLVRLNDTTSFGMNQFILKIDTLPGYMPGSYISWIAATNDSTGFPVYFLIDDDLGNSQLYVFYEGILIELNALPPELNVINVFTHPGQIAGDTVFISCRDVNTQEIFLFRSFAGGFLWEDITPMPGLQQPLIDADFSPDWISMMPLSNGLRLSLPGGLLSDDMGDSWQGTALSDYGIATNPVNIDLIVGSNNVGVAVSHTGIYGPFSNAENIGFTSVNVNEFSQSQGIYYVATDAGLAYTEEYFNPLINGYDQWIPPNGLFPVPNTGDEEGVTAVAIDPNNSEHVICGYKGGFCVTFTGPFDFTYITPIDWNTNPHLDPYVTDIEFVTSSIIVAITGMKFKKLAGQPSQPVGNIWRSIDGGLSWTLVTPYYPDEFQMGNCLAVGTSGPPVIYSGTGYNNMLQTPVPGVLWSSYNMGDTWTKVNDAPVFGGTGIPLPVYDIDIDPINSDIIYLSSDQVFVRSDDGGLNYFITDVPYNTGSFTSALIDPAFPDSVTVTAGRHIYKYNFLIDDADLKFKGMPGEFFTSSSSGSVLGGSNTGGNKITEATTYFLDLKVYIEGPFNGTDMNTQLNSSGYLPLSQPFNQPPWNYNGTESVVEIPNTDVVDWILIDLRKTSGDLSSATAETRFYRQAAFLMKDGSITDDDGINKPRFSIILSDSKDYDKVQGVVYSPSHVRERSADSLSSAKSDTYSYDFTSGPEQVWGGATAHKEIAPGVWGMISGDGNHDGQVDNADKNEVWLVQYGNTGYYFGDFNRDGTVDDTDKDDYWKPNAGTGSRIE
ncbi:MAG: hypothetical protein H8D45_27745 [Bacteroidetes bacterium]|nr:hypothetical protein [Bacteroidota bacterium]MBL7105706.1 hypothetical protein [Bacteroidales bacterium]